MVFGRRPLKALMMGHHFSISAFWKAARNSGVCWSRGGISNSKSAKRARTFVSANAATAAELSLTTTDFDVIRVLSILWPA